MGQHLTHSIKLPQKKSVQLTPCSWVVCQLFSQAILIVLISYTNIPTSVLQSGSTVFPQQLQQFNPRLLLSYLITWQGRGISLFCVNFLSNSVQCCPISSSIISSTNWAPLPPTQPSRTPSISGMTSNPVTSRSHADCCRTSTDHLVHDNGNQFTHKTFLHYKLSSLLLENGKQFYSFCSQLVYKGNSALFENHLFLVSWQKGEW